MRARATARAALVAALALGSALLAAPGAQAARIDDGAARLRFDGATLGAIKRGGLLVATILPAEASRRAATFPVTGGDLNPATGRGFLSHRGVLAIATARGRRIVELQQLRISTGTTSTLSARIGLRRITIAHLEGRLRAAHDAETTAIAPLRVTLTGPAARLLDRRLHVTLFKRGTLLGRLSFQAHLAQLVLTGGYTALTPDAGTVQALAAAGITLKPLRGTRTGSAGDVILPLVSGLVERD